MPEELKTFILYFLFAALPLVGVFLYLTLVTIEYMKESNISRVKQALKSLGIEEEVELNGRDSTDKELDKIRDALSKEEKASGRDDSVVKHKTKKLESTQPEELSGLITAVLNKGNE